MTKELKVINDCYEFIRYLAERIEKFPRYQRFTLGVAMEQRLQNILALLIRAKYTSPPAQKTPLLTDVNVELEVLRFQVRLAQDSKVLPTGSHRYANAALEQLGAQVGGWLRSLRTGGP